VPDRGGAEAAAMTDRVCELFCGAGRDGRCGCGGDSVRFLWFTAGFLLGVVTTTLGLLWMMTMAVVA